MRKLKINFVDRPITYKINIRIENFILKHEHLHALHKTLYNFLNVLFKAYNENNEKYYQKMLLKNNIVRFNGIKMILDTKEQHDYTFYKLFREKKLYEEETSKILLDNLTHGDTFIDVGANNGYFSLIACKLVGNGGRVFAFEPNPKAVKRFKRSLKINKFKNCKIFNCALGSKEENLELYESNYEDGLNSFIEIPNKGSITVPVKKLDQFKIGKIDFIKIDVEGFEFEVLMGAKKILDKQQPILIFEYNPGINGVYKRFNKIIYFLNQLKYELHEIGTNGIYKEEIKSVHQLRYMQMNILAYKRNLGD